MNTQFPKALRWVPRLLGILYMAFLSLFTFDAWEGPGSFVEHLIGFIIHLMPVFAVGLVLLVAWRWRGLGGLLFLALAVGFALAFDWEEAATLVIMAGPLVVIGLLLLVDGYVNGVRLRPRF